MATKTITRTRQSSTKCEFTTTAACPLSPLATSSHSIRTPSPSPTPERRYPSKLLFETPQFSSLPSTPAGRPSDESRPFRGRQPIISNEIWRKAEELERQLIAHKKAKKENKFQLSFLFSPKKMRDFSEKRRELKRNDPVLLAGQRRKFMDEASRATSQIDMDELVKKMRELNNSKV